MAQHPILVPNLFMGEVYPSDAVPWNYIPVWFAITAPPIALALGAIGCAAVCWQAITRPLAALSDRETRFRVLLLGCFALPIVAVIALQSNIYNGWRHMYFLWGPFCLLAAVGLHTIANISMGGGIWKVGAWLPGWIRCGGYRLHIARQALVYGVVGAGLITTLTAMAALHPHQQVYFNALTDTNTPGALANRYDLDYANLTHRQLLEYLLAHYPDGALRVWPRHIRPALMLPSSDRERIVFTGRAEADFHLLQRIYYMPNAPDPPMSMSHNIQAYDGVIAQLIAAPNSAPYLDYYRAAYADAAANGTLLARGDFDIYIHNGELIYLNADCAPLAANAKSVKIFLHLFPVNRADLPEDSRERGFENRDFSIIVNPAIFTHTGFFDGKCIAMQVLPDYPIARIATGWHMESRAIWRRDIDLAAHAAAQAVYESIASGAYGQPVAQSDFDLYLSGNSLAYLKDSCAPGDADARFFLHVILVDPADLPADWRERGFDNLDFHFTSHGAYAGDKCVAERELPDYAIERIRTGQFASGEGQLWSVEFPVAR